MREPPEPPALRIPAHWTAEQANVVLEFIAALADTVWTAYEPELVDLARRHLADLDRHQLELAFPDIDADWDDPIPF